MRAMYNAGEGFTVELLVDALALPAFFVCSDHLVRYANSRAIDLLVGGDGESLIGREIQSLVLSAETTKIWERDFTTDISGRKKSIANVMVSGQSGIYEYSVSQLKSDRNSFVGCLFQCVQFDDEREQGGAFHAVGPREPISDAQGQSSTSRDILDLAESEWRWRTAILCANQAVWDHDFERDRHFVSDTWRELRGLKPKDPFPTSNKTWLATIHTKDIDHIKEALRRLDTGESDVINYKFRQQHTDGHWVWFLSSGRVVRRDKNGRPARIIGTDTDITDIKTVEQEKHRMAERLETAMEAAGMGRWEFDVGANYAYWDNRMLELFGIEDKVNIRSSTDWGGYIHPDDREATLALAQERLEQGRDIECDYRHLNKDGTVKHIRTCGKFVQDAEHGPRYYGVNFDVTQDYERAQELELARERLEYESRHDVLTGLANRRFLDDAFTKLAKGADHVALRTAVLHFDIDHFKQINDTLGHDAGDATLKHAAEVLKQNVPDEAFVSRVGGDEFVALMFDAPDNCALVETAKSIINDMSQPFYYGSQQCNIGTSIGIAVSEPSEPLNNGLFIDADLALYAAKKAGRGRFRFFTTEMKQEARRRKNSFDALLAGFDHGEITCHYQPQFDAKTLRLTGLEALVRWESKEYGLIMPEEFLATAEDMGLVAHFDELVLRKALRDLKKWEEQGFEVPRVSVNVSSHRLNDPTLIDRLKPLDLPQGKISFELLESAFLDSKNETIERNLRKIEQMGIEIEIDDFGSGHASIVSLLQVAPNRLKIDRILIEPIVRSKRQRNLVKTIVGIGNMLDVDVVAEGVESLEHAEVLRSIGCRFLQGFGLARPMDANAVLLFLSDLDENNGFLSCA